MSGDFLSLLVADILFVAIVAGWIVLVVAGIEPDTPLSGGLPGHVDLSHLESQHEGVWGKVGARLAWIGFVLVCLSLPVILVWIWRIHGA